MNTHVCEHTRTLCAVTPACGHKHTLTRALCPPVCVHPWACVFVVCARVCTHGDIHVHIDAHSHSTCTHWGTRAHMVSPPVAHTTTQEDPSSSSPSPVRPVWPCCPRHGRAPANGHFKRLCLGPHSDCPSTSTEQPGQQLDCKRRPAARAALRDMTRPDRRKEQAPRSCKMQEEAPPWTPADQTTVQRAVPPASATWSPCT